MESMLSSNPDQKPSNVPILRGFALVVAKMVGEISVSILYTLILIGCI